MDREYKTRECERRAQKAYLCRLKSSDDAGDKLKWEDLKARKHASVVSYYRKLYENPEEYKESLDRLKKSRREWARRRLEDPDYRARVNARRRELRAEKKEKLNEEKEYKKELD